MLLRHLIERPLSFALASAGKSNDARMAMMAITTNSSISVNPEVLDVVKRGFIFRSAGKLALFFTNDHAFLCGKNSEKMAD